MSKRKYHLQAPWKAFHIDGTVFDLSHLDEYHLSALDSEGHSREILVAFSDHCFTRQTPDPDELDSQRLLYPDSSRNPGYFCRTRYVHSLLLTQYLESAKNERVWNVAGQNLAIVPVVLQDGAPSHYAVIFDLLPMGKGRPPFHLRMDVVSAYPCDASKDLITFGDVGFKKLVSIKMARKQLQKNTSKNRKRPQPLTL